MIRKHGADIYKYRGKDGGLLDFSTNTNPFGLPESVKQAAQESLGRLEYYPDVRCDDLRNALAEFEQVPEDYIICGNGATELLYALAFALQPLEALIPVPAFLEFESSLCSLDCRVRHLHLTEEKGFRLDETILADISLSMNVLFLSNPANPSGVLTDRGLLESILEKCAREDVVVVMDECFLDFADEPSKYTLHDLVPKFRNLFLLKSFTKTYAMAGLRLGYGLCSNIDLLEAMRSVVQPWNVSTPAQAAGIAAIRETGYVEAARTLVHQERIRMAAELTKAGYKVFDSGVNYLLFKGAEDLGEKALEAGYILRNGCHYEGLSKEYYRIAVRKPEENSKLLSWLHEFSQSTAEATF